MPLLAIDKIQGEKTELLLVREGEHYAIIAAPVHHRGMLKPKNFLERTAAIEIWQKALLRFFARVTRNTADQLRMTERRLELI